MSQTINVPRELMERLEGYMRQRVCPAPSGKVATELHAGLTAVLSAPRQSEGEVIKPAARVKEYTDVDGDMQHAVHWLGKKLPHGTELCRLSDAQRAIAELREECEAMAKNLRGKHATSGATYAHLIAERDTLRQQLAERDAELAMLRDNNRKEAIGVNHLLSQRDKLAGLLWEIRSSPQKFCAQFCADIDAALAEVNK